MCSGEYSEDLITEAQELGAYDWLVKLEFTKEDLIRTVQEMEDLVKRRERA